VVATHFILKYEGQDEGTQGDRTPSHIAEKHGERLLQCKTTNSENPLELK